jgi:hypothetical protein
MSTTPEIKRVAEEFAQAALTRIAALSQFFPPEAMPQTVACFLEQAVAALLQQRFGRKHFLSGIVYSETKKADSKSNCHLLDGIVYDPDKGSVTLRNGRLAILNPEVCAGVISIKASTSNLGKFGIRLGEIRKAHFQGRRGACVMGVVIADSQPERTSRVCKEGRQFNAYDFTHPKWCPVFVLFSHRDGQYRPHVPAIEALLANIHKNIQPLY